MQFSLAAPSKGFSLMDRTTIFTSSCSRSSGSIASLDRRGALVVTVRIDLAMKLVIINYVRLMRRPPLDANGTKL